MNPRTFRLLLPLVLAACISPARKDKASSRVDLGSAYLRENDAPGAIPVLEEAARLDPQSWNAWNKLGLAYMAQGATDRATKAFSKAVRLNEGAEVRNNYGILLLRTGDLEAAIEQFELALKDITYRKPALVLSNLGYALLLQGKHSDAVLRLSEAINRAPNLCQARFNRGLAYDALDNRGAALEDFETVIEICEDTAVGATFEAAQIRLKLGDPELACEELRTVMDQAQRSPLGDEAGKLHRQVCT